MVRFASLVLLAVSAAVAAPVPKANKQQLLLVRVNADTQKSQLVLVDEDGKNPNELTDGKSNASYPAWSPDGKRIAFSSDRVDGVMQVFSMDADGKNVKQLTTEGREARVPSWGAGGKTVAYCRRTDAGGSDVVVMDADGKNPTAVGDGDGWDPAFSPDGKRIAFVSFRDGGGFRLYTMDADGKNVTKLTDAGNTTGFAYPAWTADSKRIAFAHPVNDHLEVHTVDADGKNLTAVTAEKGMVVYPAWAADGKRLAAVRVTEGTKAEVVVMDADGKNLSVLVKDQTHAEGGRPVWRPR